MTTEREFHRSPTSQLLRHIDADAAPNRTTRSSRLDAPTHPEPSGLVMRKANRDGNGVADGAEALVSSAASSEGSALPATLMRKFESSLGADLSSVRIHTDGESAVAAHAVGARAYTIGQDIHFGAGQYDPSSTAGEHLLAHEVAHTVQQYGGSPIRQNKLDVSTPGDHLEAEADRAADAMVLGQSFAVTSGSGFQRKVFRDANPDARQVDSKIWIDLPQLPLKATDLGWIKIEFALKGKIGIQFCNVDKNGKAAAAQVTTGSTLHSKGVKTDVDFDKGDFTKALLGFKFEEKFKKKFSFELSAEQFKVAIGVENRVAWAELPWLQGAFDATLNFAAVKWADVRDKANAIKVLVAESAIGIAGEGDWRGNKITSALQLVSSATPNWAAIGEEAIKQGANNGAQAAGTAATSTAGAAGATATTTPAAASGAAATTSAGAAGATDATLVAGMVETGAVASAAAAVILPLAVGAAMVAGANQTEKNIVASRAAIAAGVKMRNEVDRYVAGYLDALAGRSSTGPGATAGNAALEAYVAATGKPRDQAAADLAAKNGGRDTLAANITSRLRDQLYAGAVKWFEGAFANRFGLIEKVGETWGMRGVFRNDLYRVLYTGDTSVALGTESDAQPDDMSAVASLAGPPPTDEDTSAGPPEVGGEPPEQMASADVAQEADEAIADGDSQYENESGSDEYA